MKRLLISILLFITTLFSFNVMAVEPSLSVDAYVTSWPYMKVKISLGSGTGDQISGLQFDLDFDSSKVQFEGTSTVLGTGANHTFNSVNFDGNTVRVVMQPNDNDNKTTMPGGDLVAFDFKILSNSGTTNAFQLNNTSSILGNQVALSLSKSVGSYTYTWSTSDNESDGIPDQFDPDDDNDGMPDWYESKYGLNPFYAGDANQDPDNDGLTNLQESQYNTDPNNPDTDGDGINDGDEVAQGRNPNIDDALIPVIMQIINSLLLSN